MVTGSSGFIGGHLLEAVGGTGLDLKEGNDIRVCEFPDEKVIFHCAAQASIPKSLEDPLESYSHNVEGTIRVLKHALKTGASVVFSSSSSVYHPNSSPYAEQKAICEEFLETYWDLGVKSVALRYFNVFGERQEIANEGEALVLARFLAQYKRGEPFTIYGNGLQRRDFVYVKDVVDANIKAVEFLKTAKKFEVIDIGSGTNYSINAIADMIDKDHPRINLPPRDEPFENLADISKAKELLGWEPKTTLEAWLQA
jgi:UDP-glucose 4-epimerase